MPLGLLIGVPAAASAIAYVQNSARARTVWLLATAAGHLILTAWLWTGAQAGGLGGWIAVDSLGLIVLTIVSVLFLVVAVYTVGVLRVEPRGGRTFVTCLLGFLSAATLVALAHHMALLWIGMEATTLAIAPLVYQRRDRRSLEAVWKYLVLSSVGI